MTAPGARTSPSSPTGRSQVVLLGILAAIAIGWVFRVAAPILLPVVMALLLAGVLQPIVTLGRRVHIPPVLTVIGLTALLFYGLGRLGVEVADSMQEFFGGTVAGAPQLQAGDPSSGAAPAVPPGVQGTGAAEPDWPQVLEGLTRRVEASTLPAPARDFAVEWLRQLDLAEIGRKLIGSGVHLVNSVFLVVFYLVFILAESGTFRRKILRAAGPRSADAKAVLHTIGWGIQRYLSVHTLVSLATALSVYLGMLVIGIPFALLFAFLQFLLHYIPTFGSIIAGALATATALAVEPSIEKPILVALLFLVVNMVLGNYLEPKILGRELNLSPLVIILSVVVWTALWGVAGAFLAVPMTGSIQIVLANFETTRPIALILSSGRGLEPEPGER